MNLYSSVAGITATTVIKSAAGFVWGISVTVSGSTLGGVYDAAAVSGATVLGPQVIIIPGVTGLVPNVPHIGWPCQTGIIVVPGSGQTVNIAFQ